MGAASLPCFVNTPISTSASIGSSSLRIYCFFLLWLCSGCLGAVGESGFSTYVALCISLLSIIICSFLSSHAFTCLHLRLISSASMHLLRPPRAMFWWKACFSVYREIWYSPHLSSNVARRYSAPLAGFESIMRAGQADDSLFAASLRLSLITSILRERLVYKPYCSIKTAHCVQIICLHKLLIKCLTCYIDKRGESGYHYVKQMINAICRGGIVYEKEDSAC